MTALCKSIAVALVTSIAIAATAQTPSAPAAPAPMMGGNTMAHDCAKPAAKHDHGAERGTPRPMSTSKPCEARMTAAVPTGAASAAKVKKPLKHDHGAEKNN
jgi:hypothetical protein